MEKNFNFNSSVSFESNVDVKDIFQTALEAIDNYGNLYYLLINTDLGRSSIIEFGPIIPDNDDVSNNFTLTHINVECKTQQVSKIINKFLSPRYGMKNKIIEAREITWEEAIEFCPNVYDFVNKTFKRSEVKEDE